jgi:integration host factor subunit beta
VLPGRDVDDRAEWGSGMTRADLVDELARVANLTKQDSEAVVDTVFAAITDALARGDKVEIRGFGSFKIRQRRSRVGRNPKTGASVSVPGKKVPFFKVGKGLRELVNTGESAAARPRLMAPRPEVTASPPPLPAPGPGI